MMMSEQSINERRSEWRRRHKIYTSPAAAAAPPAPPSDNMETQRLCTIWENTQARLKDNQQRQQQQQQEQKKHKSQQRNSPDCSLAPVLILLILFIIRSLISTTTLVTLAQSQSNEPPAGELTSRARQQHQQQQQQQQHQLQQQQDVPTPIQSASYISLDGLTLVVVFNRPLNLSASIESVEQRQAAAAGAFERDSAESESRARRIAILRNQNRNNNNSNSSSSSSSTRSAKKQNFHKLRPRTGRDDLSFAASFKSEVVKRQVGSCPLASGRALSQALTDQATPHVIGGVQLCAALLTRKTLKLLHKHRLFNCLWASQVQFLIQLGKPIGGGGALPVPQPGTSASTPVPVTQRLVRVTFRRGTLSEAKSGASWNEQEVSVELSKLPLEGLGVPLSPRLALTGPNQVPPCGQFSLSAHLSSPYGTEPDEAVRLRWSVERHGVLTPPASGASSGSNNSAASAAPSAQVGSQAEASALAELRWQALKQLVAQERSNNLVLDARLFQFVPQLYEFSLEAIFTTSLTSFTLNATHQLGKLDFDAPIGTIYGTHLLAPEQQLNTNQELALLADIQVPECAQNIKQVGLYWQVSDPRVRFEQTYAPFYLAKSNTLPEQALIEFRLNLFYGIRVKKFASAGTLVPTGESILDAQISDGLLMASVAQPQDLIGGGGGGSQPQQPNAEHHLQLELFAISRDKSAREQQDKFTYQWSCFDGKTAQPCHKSLKVQASSGGTRYDVGTPSSGTTNARGQTLLARPQPSVGGAAPGALSDASGAGGAQQSPLLLVDRARQRQATLRLPLSWLDADAQLWFGLQRFDRANPSQHSKTEYALVSVHPVTPPDDARSTHAAPVAHPVVVSIGPVLIGASRQRATIRNPLTGAIVLLANAPAVIVGRLSLGSASQRQPNDLSSFSWHSPNYPHPLHWTARNVTNPLNGQAEILTELHLDREMLLAHAHHQVQLSICTSGADDARSTASVSLDVVQGITQCRVELLLKGGAAAATLAGNPSVQPGGSSSSSSSSSNNNNSDQQDLPLVVTVNYCNIPLGLSPITYQLYIIDTSSSDGFVAGTTQPPAAGTAAAGTSTSTSTSTTADEDYLNEADELFHEAQAEPLSVPQLSPVFSLGAMSVLALGGLVQRPKKSASEGGGADQAPPTRVRFAVRVCDRLQSCQMFYSSSIDPLALIGSGGGGGGGSGLISSATPTNESLALGPLSAVPNALSERLVQAAPPISIAEQSRANVRALRQTLEAAKRANTAGNSVAAVAISNAALKMAERMLASLEAEQRDAASEQADATPRRQKKRQKTKKVVGGGGGGGSQSASGVRYSSESDDEEAASLREENNTSARLSAEGREGGEAAGGKDQQQQQQQQQKASAEQHEQEAAAMRLRDAIQVAMRDALAYGAKSTQRHFHYTESGQTNLVIAAMSRILASPLASFEYKFRALRLIVMLVRRTLEGAAAVSTSAGASDDATQTARLLLTSGAVAAARSAPDYKTIQLAYESLFGTLAQHSTASASQSVEPQLTSSTAANARVTDKNLDSVRRSSSGGSDLSESPSSGSYDLLSVAATTSAAASAHQQQVSAHATGGSSSLLKSSSRRNKEEAILAYLKLARTALRTLLQSAASQLPLGAVHSFAYQSPGGFLGGGGGGGGGRGNNNGESGGPSGPVPSFSATAANLAAAPLPPLAQHQQHQQHGSGNNNNNNFVEATKFLASEQPPAYVVSSLTHQTNLPDNSIELDLREFGGVHVKYGAHLAAKLARQMRRAQLRCQGGSNVNARNATQQQQRNAKCSSFVLALSSFAGKAPFRALDLSLSSASSSSSGKKVNRLLVPVVQVDWLSPLDGSNLIELLRQQRLDGENAETDVADVRAADVGDLLTLEDFRATVTFTLPAESRNDAQAAAASSSPPPPLRPYKCYKFDEQANEWTPLASASAEQLQRPVNTGDDTPPGPGATGEQQQVQVQLTCTFDGFGTLGAFSGEPPSSSSFADTPTELSIALGVALVLAIVSVFSLLGCAASKAKKRERRPSSASALSASDLDSASQDSKGGGSSSYASDLDSARGVQVPQQPAHLTSGRLAALAGGGTARHSAHHGGHQAITR